LFPSHDQAKHDIVGYIDADTNLLAVDIIVGIDLSYTAGSRIASYRLANGGPLLEGQFITIAQAESVLELLTRRLNKEFGNENQD
jgi:hypothetical protein